ncbi:MAG: flavodoxin [Clostridium sp.]|nr:flavodoxin [Clostridium sp.]
MSDKKLLVVFYSRTGITKKVAHTISELLNCDLEEIYDTKDRSGVVGYLKAGRDATRNRGTVVKDIKNEPSSYDMVIIGTPIWAFTMSSPIKTYIDNNKEKFKKVAFFCTQGGSGSERAFSHMTKECKIEPVELLELKTLEVVKNNHIDKIKEFVENIKNSN